mmetsp:Transcript_87707/g.107483  ORF Transcript_87707/g.107483 Transcript_87707/m.107483 type:complete len:236 (+) Transcript_87707:106-813(+)
MYDYFQINNTELETRFFPATIQVREWINDGSIGDIINVDCNFGVKMPSINDAPRLWENKLGGGALLDIGIYNIAALTMIFGPQMPDEIKCIGNIVNDVDSMFACLIKYNDTKYATIHSTMHANTFEELSIVGTNGRIKIHIGQHAPTKISMISDNDGTETTIKYKLPNNFKYPMYYGNAQGLEYQCNEVIKCLDEGRIESPLNTWNDTQISMQIMDEIRKQIGLTYNADKIKSKL